FDRGASGATDIGVRTDTPLEPRKTSTKRYLSWVESGCGKDLALSDALAEVKPENPRRRCAFIGQGLDDGASKHEVILPTLNSRVEETDKPAGDGINGANIAALP